MTNLWFFFQSIAYLLSGNMDRGSVEYQLEAAISKIYASVSGTHSSQGSLTLHTYHHIIFCTAVYVVWCYTNVALGTDIYVVVWC